MTVRIITHKRKADLKVLTAWPPRSAYVKLWILFIHKKDAMVAHNILDYKTVNFSP